MLCHGSRSTLIDQYLIAPSNLCSAALYKEQRWRWDVDVLESTNAAHRFRSPRYHYKGSPPWRQSSPRNPSNPHLSSNMAMKRVSTIFRSSPSSAGPSSSDTSPLAMVRDDESVSTEIAEVKSQQTAVAVLPPPNLKIKVRLRASDCSVDHPLTTFASNSALITTTPDGEVGSTRTPDPKSSPRPALS